MNHAEHLANAKGQNNNGLHAVDTVLFCLFFSNLNLHKILVGSAGTNKANPQGDGHFWYCASCPKKAWPREAQSLHGIREAAVTTLRLCVQAKCIGGAHISKP